MGASGGQGALGAKRGTGGPTLGSSVLVPLAQTPPCISLLRGGRGWVLEGEVERGQGRGPPSTPSAVLARGAQQARPLRHEVLPALGSKLPLNGSGGAILH